MNACICVLMCTCVRKGQQFSFQQHEERAQGWEVPVGQVASHQAVWVEEVEDLDTCRWVGQDVVVPSWGACHPVGGKLGEGQASSGRA